MSDTQAQLRSLVENFVADLTDLVRQAALAQVSAALGAEGSAPARGRRGAKAAPKLAKRPKGAKRSAAEMEALLKTIVKTVSASPGIRADQLASELGVETRELALPIKKLLADKLLTKKGQKRATSYSVKAAK